MSRRGIPGAADGMALSALARTVGLLGLWLVFFGAAPVGLPVGLATAGAASWASLLLLPPGTTRARPGLLARLVPRFLWRSAVAGFDVARRALDPRLPLRPGFVTCPVTLAPGPARQAFRVLSSLQPGTLPIGPDEDGMLTIHCLDTTHPVATRMAIEEALLAKALGMDAADE
jgi:multicomponent Na+:H+ antiporter subunit E